MIIYHQISVLESQAHVLVNPVNTVGVMGKGLALAFKQRYPDMFEQYRALCSAGQFQIGTLWLYKGPDKWVLNFPTKKHWRHQSKPEYIEAGLQQFVATYAQLEITGIAFPMLGCGSGDLDWETQVHPLMQTYLTALPINVHIHLFSPAPAN